MFKYPVFLRELGASLSKHNLSARLIFAIYPHVLRLARKTSPLYGSITQLSLTGKCQCSCAHCGAASYRSGDRPELSRKEALSLISKIADLGGEEIVFIGGEPLMAPWAVECVAASTARRLRTSLDTNGYLLDEAMVVSLKAAGLGLVRVSLDSPYEEEHDAERKRPGLYKKVLEGVTNCVKHGLNCHLSVCATAGKLKDERIKKITELGRKFGVKVRIMSPVRCGNLRADGEAALWDESIRRLRNLLSPGRVYWETELADNKDHMFLCACSIKKVYYISHHGDVQPCIYMPVSFGNIREAKLEEITTRLWASGHAEADAKRDCPTNGKSFISEFGRALSISRGAAVPYEARSSANDPAEWEEWSGSYTGTIDRLEQVLDAVLLRLLGHRGKRVLDVGCGTGRLAQAMSTEAGHVALMDPSTGMLEKARQRLGGCGNVSFFSGDIEKDVPPGGNYDVITAVSVMHHLASPGLAVENMKSALAPGGKIIIVDQVLKNNLTGLLIYSSRILTGLGPVKCAALFYALAKRDSLLARHMRKEALFTLDDFKRRYAGTLPEARITTLSGVFACLEWTAPA